MSWRHPRSKHWHQLDMILTKRGDLNNVQNTRSKHSAGPYDGPHPRPLQDTPRPTQDVPLQEQEPPAHQRQPRIMLNLNPDSVKPSKRHWRKAEEMQPLQTQSGSKCEPPPTNHGWKPLGRSVVTRTGSRRTGRKLSQRPSA